MVKSERERLGGEAGKWEEASRGGSRGPQGAWFDYTGESWSAPQFGRVLWPQRGNGASGPAAGQENKASVLVRNKGT